MKITRKKLKTLILKEFNKLEKWGEVNIDTGEPPLPPLPPIDDDGRGDGGGGGMSWLQAYRAMQRQIVPLLITYMETGGDNYEEIETAISYDNELWKIISAGPFPTGDEEDSNVELADMFLSCMIDEPGGALYPAIQASGLDTRTAVIRFVANMLHINRSHMGEDPRDNFDFLEHVSHSWESGNEQVTQQFVGLIVDMMR